MDAPGWISECDDALRELLVTIHGDAVVLPEEEEPAAPLSRYQYPLGGSEVRVGFEPCHFEPVALLSARIRLGMVWGPWDRAKFWLDCNRAGQTVTACFDDRRESAQEVVLSFSRMQVEGDPCPLVLLLSDVAHETARVEVGLRYWFPRFACRAEIVHTAQMLGLSELPTEEEALRKVYESLRRTNPVPESDSFEALRRLARWLGDWKTLIACSNRQREEAVGLTPWRVCVSAVEEAVALMELRDFERAARTARNAHRFAPPGRGARCHTVEARAWILCRELERAAAALQRIQNFAEEPSGLLLRAYVAAKIESLQQAFEWYSRYELLLGPDYLARDWMEKVMLPQ